MTLINPEERAAKLLFSAQAGMARGDGPKEKSPVRFSLNYSPRKRRFPGELARLPLHGCPRDLSSGTFSSHSSLSL